MKTIKEQMELFRQAGIDELSLAGVLIQEGKIEGKKEGLIEGKKEVVHAMLSKGQFSLQEIAEYTGLSLEKIQEIQKELKANKQ